MTNYKGFLMKINGNLLDHRFIRDYKSTPMKQTDINPWTDNNGITHRNVVPHRRTTITFMTPPLCLEDKIKLQELYPDRIRMEIEYWNDEINDYSKGEFYIPDVTFEVLMAYKDTIMYRPVTYEFIEY